MSKTQSVEKSEQSRPKVDPGLRVVLRNQGVYSLYKKIIAMFWASVGLAIFSVFVASFFIFQKTPPEYAQASMDGKLIQSIPLSQPNMDEAGVFNLARKAITAVNRYDYINYKTQIPEAEKYFTPVGWGNYLKQLKDRGTLKSVEEQRDIVSVEFTGPATLIKSQPFEIAKGNVQYVWVVDQPVQVNYISHSASSSTGGLYQQGVVRLYIVRMPYTDSTLGAAIQIYNFMEKGKSS